MSVPIINLMQRDENLNNFCPFCGINNADNEGNVSECPHLLFIYVNIAEEMIYVKKNLFPYCKKMRKYHFKLLNWLMRFLI